MGKVLPLLFCVIAGAACGDSGAGSNSGVHGPSDAPPGGTTTSPTPDMGASDASIRMTSPNDGDDAATAPPTTLPDGGVRARSVLSIVTIAGKNGNVPGFSDGIGKNAQFNFPEGAAMDKAGTILYVADTNNHAVRKIDLATNDVTTIAGTPGRQGNADGHPGQLNLPRSMAMDAAGKYLYVTDTGNYTIRKIDLTTLAMTTLVGTAGTPGTNDGTGGAAQFGLATQQDFWAGGLAIDETSNPAVPVMYVSDSANQTIRKVELLSRLVTTVAGKAGAAAAVDGVGLAARFNKPNGIAIDPTGKYLYLSESNAIDIRKIELATMTVTTVAGKAPADPTRVCDDSNPIPPYPPECDSADGDPGTNARFRTPFGIAMDGQDGLYIVDAHNDLVRKMSLATTAVTTVAGVQQTITDDNPHGSTDSTPTQAGTFWHPTHAVFQGPNVLYVIDRGASCVRKVILASP